MMSHALSAFVALSLAIQVAPPRDGRPRAMTGSGWIHGRIVAGDTGRPLSRVRISLSAPELGSDGRSTSTNGDGRYEINDLPAARYTLSVARSGYLVLRYGQRRPLEQAKPLELVDNQRLDHIDFALPPTSAISGRITDEAGDPAAGAAVFAMRSMYVNGRRQLVSAGEGLLSADEAGEYRIVGLAPGTYVVMTWLRDLWTVNSGSRPETMAYGVTYFPGTTNAATAQRIIVGLGQEARNTDFSLMPARAATISGTALDSRGRPLAFVDRTQRIGDISTTPGGAPVADDGTFTLRNVPPGEYTLGAASARPGEAESARLSIVVDGVDVENVALVASPGWSISGTITTENGAVPAFPRDRTGVGARPLDTFGGAFIVGSPEYSQTLKDDWTFAISGLTGPARLRVRLPEGWIVKAAMHDGHDIADAPIEAKAGGAVSGVHVMLTNRVASVTGQLTDDGGRPLADGTVIVFPEDREKRFEGSRYMRTARPDQNGRYQMKDIPPGEYFAVALDYVEDGIWNDPDYLDSLPQYAQKLTLGEGVVHRISLQLVTVTR